MNLSEVLSVGATLSEKAGVWLRER